MAWLVPQGGEQRKWFRDMRKAFFGLLAVAAVVPVPPVYAQEIGACPGSLRKSFCPLGPYARNPASSSRGFCLLSSLFGFPLGRAAATLPLGYCRVKVTVSITPGSVSSA